LTRSGTLYSSHCGFWYGVDPLSSAVRPASRNLALFQQRHESYLRESEEEINRLQKEIAAMRRAAAQAEGIKKL